MTPNEYIMYQQKSHKWEACLYSMARELENMLSQQQLIGLMRGTGERMAQGFPNLDLETLTDVGAVVNEVWKESDWGWVKFYEEENIVKVEHYCSPLNAAFGEEAKAWTVALLEGFYTEVFHQLGAGRELSVCHCGDLDSTGVTVFNLSAG